MKIAIGSISERKVRVAQKVFQLQFNGEDVKCEAVAAQSLVPETPYDQQILEGSRNRAAGARKQQPDAHYFIGLESGLVERYGQLYEESWATVINQSGSEFFGYSSGLKVPEYVQQKMKEFQLEHSDIMTELEKEHGGLPNDTWGSYSGGVLVRDVSLEESLRNALIQASTSQKSFLSSIK